MKAKKVVLTIIAALAAVLITAFLLFVFGFMQNNSVDGVSGIAREVLPRVPKLTLLTEIPRMDDPNDLFAGPYLEYRDLTGADLSGRLPELLASRFSERTVWPEKLPAGFDPELFLENGKNPGLGVRSLHEAGIDGTGVSIGIIDSVLLTNHSEYSENLVFYEEIHADTRDAEPHGGAVTSIAVGKTVGVAPAARVYYIAANSSANRLDLYRGGVSYKYYARALHRLLDVNEQLGEDEKIGVVSISLGFGDWKPYYDEMMEAIDRAREQGVFVVSTTLHVEYGFSYAGLYRDPMGDPDDLASYSAGTWHREDLESHAGSLFFPMEWRSYASHTDENGYACSAAGGASWVMPYVSGLYALAVQVCPEVTPELFWEAAVSTADTVIDTGTGEAARLAVVNPGALITHLGGKS